MAYDEIVKQEFANGAFAAIHPDSKCILKLKPGKPPIRFEKEDPNTPHYICTDFVFKPLLRRNLDPQIEQSEIESEQITLEKSFMDFVLGRVVSENASVSFPGDHEDQEGETKASRLDFVFRLEQYGFKRNKKTKVVYRGLIDPDAYLDQSSCKNKKKRQLSRSTAVDPLAGQFLIIPNESNVSEKQTESADTKEKE